MSYRYKALYLNERRTSRQLREELEKCRNRPVVSSKADIIMIALQLFLKARIGFRAVSRVMSVLAAWIGLDKAPCHQTVINWVLRLSIVRMNSQIQGTSAAAIQGDTFSNGRVWIMDISIGLGVGKILSVLSMNINHFDSNPKAPALSDVQCMGISVAKSWTGETIADFLQSIIAVAGRPVAFLKDGGKDLAKSMDILSEKGLPSLSIDDVSHVAANALKHEYKAHPMMDTFLSLCGGISKKFKQTVLACLAPPKVSIKGRFMKLHRLMSWADHILKHSPPGRASRDSLLEKLRTGIEGLPQCKSLIRHFLRDARLLLECQKILKNRGLGDKSWQECEELLSSLPVNSNVRREFEEWGNRHLDIAKSLGMESTGIPISSDIIESLYGVGKQHGTGNLKDASRIAIRLPVFCGARETTLKEARSVCEVTVKQQLELAGTVSSLASQRMKVLPNPGTLETLAEPGDGKHLEILPVNEGPKVGRIICNLPLLIEDSKKQSGTMIDGQIRAIPPPEVDQLG